MKGHEGHDTNLVFVSWGTKEQCNTCEAVIAAWDETSTLLPYIPAYAQYTP